MNDGVSVPDNLVSVPKIPADQKNSGIFSSGPDWSFSRSRIRAGKQLADEEETGGAESRSYGNQL